MAAALDLPRTGDDAWVDRVGWYALLVAVAALQLSIAVAQIAIACAALAWTSKALRHGVPALPRFALPLGLYAGLTLLSAGVSRDPAVKEFM